VKRWLIWLTLPLVVSLYVLANRATSQSLLADTDTIAIVRGIAERQNPWSWFTGDWPLGNHFYRPISTLPFELDYALHPTSGAGYGLTNALIAILCIWLLFWFARELLDTPWLAGLSSLIYGIWHVTTYPFEIAAQGLTWACWLLPLGLIRGGKAKIWSVVLAILCLLFLSHVIVPPEQISNRIIHWLPGRTASTMLIFCLISLAAYARYERLTARRLPPPPPAATDLPATKGTVIANPDRLPWIWILVSVAGLLLALGSYEQAVMLPACLLAVAVIFRTERRLPHWGWQALFWGLLFGYLILRSQIIPSDVSQYQAQQFRNGPSVYYSLLGFFVPGFASLQTFVISVQTGLLILMTTSAWAGLFQAFANIGAAWAAWKDRDRWLILGTLCLAFLSYLPMAWLKPFEHYWYWPCAMWAIFLLLFARLTLRHLISAVALPARQAPPRSRPAPGSLPHP